MKNERIKKVPTHLSHKPIYAMNGYDKVDGVYKNDTDVVGISVGKAQWDEQNIIPSVKVWRYKNGTERWSRQSEETTITRALDMAMLVIKVLDNHYNGKAFEGINSIFGELTVEKMECNPTVVREFNDFLDTHKKDINTHIDILYNAIMSYKDNK